MEPGKINGRPEPVSVLHRQPARRRGAPEGIVGSAPDGNVRAGERGFIPVDGLRFAFQGGGRPERQGRRTDGEMSQNAPPLRKIPGGRRISRP